MIRRINRNDFYDVYKLGNEYDNCFQKKYNLELYVDNPLYLIKCYEDNGIIKGFIIATKMYGTSEILLVYVEPKYRCNGIATKLLLDLEKKDVDNLLLEVAINNVSALNLYKKLDYQVISTRKKYYNGIDALVMRKELK